MRILIIDDSPADRELAIRALQGEYAGAEFVEIGRKGEFADVLAAGGFDAVLSDFRIHWTNGLHILREVKARYPYVPVVFMTESGSEEVAVEGMKAGLSDYVLKQHLQRLPIAIGESLEKARLRQGYDQALAELQRAHDELHLAAQDLEQRVTARTAELAETNEALRQEMTERRRAEERREELLQENRRQRELLEHLIASAPVGIAVVGGPEHAYEFANPTYRELLGIRTGQAIAGRPFAQVSPDLSELVPELLAAAREGGQAVSLREFERGPGDPEDTLHYWDLDTTPLHNAEGEVEDVLVLVSDVTQKVLARVQAEDLAIQLAAERRFLASIMDNVPVQINYLDQDLNFRQANRATARELGRPVEQIIGHHVHEIVPDNPEVWEALEGVLRTGKACYLSSLTIRWPHRPDEGERYYTAAFLPDKDEAGRVRGVFAESQDVTEPVAMRHELERAKAELERRVQERTAALEAANDRLSKQAEQLRSLSHHLVTIQEAQQKALSRELHDRSGQSLTAIKLGLGLLRRKAEGSPAIQAQVDVLRQMADQAADELHHLAVSLRPLALDRYGLVPGLEQLIESFRKQNAVDVAFAVNGLDESRLADETESALYRVTQEGLTNIARHAHATRVDITLSRDGGMARLTLKDDGRGFDVDEALQSGRLGLMGMRERAEMLGGTLTIESAPGGGGTTVFVEAPCHPTRADALDSNASQANFGSGHQG